MKSISYLFEARRAGKTHRAMKEYFDRRTGEHIDRVRDYLQKIIALNDPRLDNKILEKEKPKLPSIISRYDFSRHNFPPQFPARLFPATNCPLTKQRERLYSSYKHSHRHDHSGQPDY